MPFVDSSLSRIGSNLIDGGLRIATSASIGKSILIIGTSADGPVNIPIRLADIGGINRASEVFGSISRGSLLHTAIECGNANNSPKDIRLLRISGGNKSLLDLKEVVVGGTSANLESYDYSVVPAEQFASALVLEALYPGQVYNQVSVRYAGGDGIKHLASNYLVFYNPKTGIESWISYDAANFTTDVDVHTMQELADKINADPNLNTVIQATVQELEADYILSVSDPGYGGDYSVGVTADSNGFFSVCLSQRTPIYATGSPAKAGISDVTVTGGSSNVPTTGNLIKQFLELYEIREKAERLSIVGRNYATLIEIPIKGSSAAETDTIIKYIGEANVAGEYATPQMILHYHNSLIGTITSGATYTYTFTSPVCPDDSINQKYFNASQSMVVINSLQARSVLAGEFSTVALKATRNNVTTVIPSGMYALAYAPATDTVTVTFDGPTSALSGYLVPGAVLTADYDTVVEDLTAEAGSRTAVLNAENWHLYFVSGKTITFGDTLPADVSLRYRFKNMLEEGSDFLVSSSSNSSRDDTIRFLNLESQPQISGTTDVAPARIGLRYLYDPQWVDVSTVQTLNGGTDGISMTNFRKYELLDAAFKTVSDYPVGIIVLAEIYADDTKLIYGVDSGTPTTVNAGFQNLFHTHLEALTGTTSETVGIMSIQPAASDKNTDISTWVDRLTRPDPTDPTRAANFLPAFGSKYITILAAEPIFSNEAAFVPYVGTAEGLYAGLLASLPINTSPTGKPIFGIAGLRYSLSGGVDGQLDRLTKARYVTFRLNQTGVPVVTAGVTFAPSGSDYQREMTRSIVFQVMAMIRQIVDPYLGEGNSMEIRNAMHTAINVGLQKLVEMKPPALQAYDFAISSTPDEQINGIVRIDLVLVPVFELREVRVTLKLKATL